KAAGFDPRKLHRGGARVIPWRRAFGRRMDCLWHLGRCEQAYAECEPVEEAFSWLCAQCEHAGRTDDLERIVGRHRTRCPDDPTTPYWQAIVHWNRKEYAKAVPCFEEHLRVAPVRRRFDWYSENKRFRCFVRLGRLDEALVALLEAKK